MNYINATTRCYSSVLFDGQGKIVSLNNPQDSFLGEFLENGDVSVGNFYIQTEITVMGTNKEDADNPINDNMNLHFTLRITACDSDPQKQTYNDIDEFDIDLGKLKEDHRLIIACYPFLSTFRITGVKKILLPPSKTGKYVLKVLVRTTNNPEDNCIQSMSPFNIQVRGDSESSC